MSIVLTDSTLEMISLDYCVAQFEFLYISNMSMLIDRDD